jgi:hypothetical protein
MPSALSRSTPRRGHPERCTSEHREVVLWVGRRDVVGPEQEAIDTLLIKPAVTLIDCGVATMYFATSSHDVETDMSKRDQ